MERLLYTPEEAAEVLAVSRAKIYELVGSGALYSVKIGRSRRVPAESLRRFIEALTPA